MDDVPSAITLVSYEGDEFVVSSKILKVSEFLAELPDFEGKVFLDFLGIDSQTLKILIIYCRHYGYEFPKLKKTCIESPNLSDHLQDPWDSDFISRLNEGVLLKVLEASNKLMIKHIQDLCCLRIGMIFKEVSLENVESEVGVDLEDVNEHSEFVKEFYRRSWMQ